MIRVLVFVIGVIAAALSLAWLADRPGAITIEWLGYEIKTSAFVGALALAALVTVLILAWALLRYLFSRPAAIAAYRQERRRRQGFDALTRGLLAIGVGDRAQAQRYAGVARRNLPNEPLTALLKAQAAQLKGDRASARRAFEAMLDRPETELLGLRGLFLEAKRGNDNGAARALAEQAVRTDPHAGWSVNALFDMQAREGDWEGALATLAVARKHGNVEPDVALRRRAVLLTAEARDLETSQPDKALALAHRSVAACALADTGGGDRRTAACLQGREPASKPSRRPHLEARAASGPCHRLRLRQAWQVAARASEAGRASCKPHASATSKDRSPSPLPPSKPAIGSGLRTRSRLICTTGRRPASAP